MTACDVGVGLLLAGETVGVTIAAVAGAVGEPVVDGSLPGIVLAERPRRMPGGVLLQLGTRRVPGPPTIVVRLPRERRHPLGTPLLAGEREDRTIRSGRGELGGVVAAGRPFRGSCRRATGHSRAQRCRH